MVPVPVVGWHEEQIDELFASLLGKGTGIGEDDGEDQEKGIFHDALKDGFKVFG